MNVCSLGHPSFLLRFHNSLPAAQMVHTILRNWGSQDSKARIAALHNPWDTMAHSITTHCWHSLPHLLDFPGFLLISFPLLKLGRSFSPIQHCCKILRLFLRLSFCAPHFESLVRRLLLREGIRRK